MYRVSECEQLWQKLGVRRWERALQTTLGFGPAASTSFARPRRSSSRDQQAISGGGGLGAGFTVGKQRSNSGSGSGINGGIGGVLGLGGGSAPHSRTSSYGSLSNLGGSAKPGSR